MEETVSSEGVSRKLFVSWELFEDEELVIEIKQLRFSINHEESPPPPKKKKPN